jgi:hypothetical protein
LDARKIAGREQCDGGTERNRTGSGKPDFDESAFDESEHGHGFAKRLPGRTFRELGCGHDKFKFHRAARPAHHHHCFRGQFECHATARDAARGCGGGEIESGAWRFAFGKI